MSCILYGRGSVELWENGADLVSAGCDFNLWEERDIICPLVRVLGDFDPEEVRVEGDQPVKTTLETETRDPDPELGEVGVQVMNIYTLYFDPTMSGKATISLDREGDGESLSISWHVTDHQLIISDEEGHSVSIVGKTYEEMIPPDIMDAMVRNKERIKAVKYAPDPQSALEMLKDIAMTQAQLEAKLHH